MYDVGEGVFLGNLPLVVIDQVISTLKTELKNMEQADMETVERANICMHIQARIDRFREYKDWRIEYGINCPN